MKKRKEIEKVVTEFAWDSNSLQIQLPAYLAQ